KEKCVCGLLSFLPKPLREMSGSNPLRSRESAEAQLVHVRVHQLFHPPQACGTETASKRPYRSVAHGITIDECRSQSLLHGIEKQPPTGEARRSLSINRCRQSGDTWINQVIGAAQFDLARRLICGCR